MLDTGLASLLSVVYQSKFTQPWKRSDGVKLSTVSISAMVSRSEPALVTVAPGELDLGDVTRP